MCAGERGTCRRRDMSGGQPDPLQERGRPEAPEHERDEAVRVLETFAFAFADLSPEEIERETTRALSEVRAEQRVASS